MCVLSEVHCHNYCVRVSVARACVRACVREHACVCACARARVCVKERFLIIIFNSVYISTFNYYVQLHFQEGVGG